MASNVLRAVITADTSNFNKNIDEASGSIEELRAISKSLKGEISGLDATMRASKGGKALQSELKAVNNELKTLEKQAGLSGAATGSALTKGFSGLRTIAQILPGIGIAGILGLAFEGVEKLISGLIDLGNNLDPIKDLGTALDGAKKNFVDASTNVSRLREEIDLAKKGFISKSAVVKEYNETIGKTTGFVSSLEEAEKKLNENAEAYIRFTLLKAAANVALGKAAEAAFKVQEAIQTSTRGNTSADDRIAAGFTAAKAQEAARLAGKTGQEQARAYNDAFDKALGQGKAGKELAQQAEFTQIGNDLLKQAAELAKSFGFNFDEVKQKTDTTVKDTIAKAKELADFFDKRSIRDIKFEVDPTDSIKETFEKAKKVIKSLTGSSITTDFKLPVGFDFNVVDTEKASEKFSAAFKKVLDQYPDLQEKLGKQIEVLTKRNPILIKGLQIQLDIEAAKKKLLQQSQDLVNAIQGAVENAVVGVGEAIGAAFAGQDIGKQLFSVIGDLIEQIGKALIKFGLVKSGLDAILANPLALPGGVAIALGIAAVAIGSLVKNIKVSGQRAMGGPVVGGNAYLVGERGPELFQPNVSGKIIPNSALTGSRPNAGGTQLYGTVKVSGADLILAISNASKSQRRLN